VDEWRAVLADLELWRAESIASRDMLESGDIEAPWRAEVARLQAGIDALHAILASGCDACAHAAPKHPVSQEATLAEMRGALDDDEPERTDP
jgi:hypothetical protein